MANDLEYSLGLDTGPFRRAGEQAAQASETIGKKIAGNFQFKNLGASLATALGLNIQNIADQLARLFTGLTKEEEANYAKLDTLSDQLAEKQLAAMRERLTDEQRYQLLLSEQERLQQRIADNLGQTTADQLRLKQDQLRLLDVEKESATALARIESERGKVADENYRNEQKLAEQLGKIKADIAADEAKSRQSEYDYEQKLAADRLSYIDANFERLTLEAKAVRGLTTEEAARLEVLRLQAQQLDVQSSIRAVLSLEKRTPEEEKALTLLLRQNDTLSAQITAKQQLTAATQDQVAAEKDVAEAIGFALGKLQSFVAEWTGFTISVQTMGRGNAQLSDRELARKATELRADIARRESREFQRGAMVGVGGTADVMLPGQVSQLAQLNNELRLRDEVRRAAAAFGEDQAFRQFAGLTEQRFADILRGTTEQQRTARETADGIKELNNRLKAGIPVISLNPAAPSGG